MAQSKAKTHKKAHKKTGKKSRKKTAKKSAKAKRTTTTRRRGTTTPDQPEELAEARQKVEATKSELAHAEESASELTEKARALTQEARNAYRDAVSRYRTLCLAAGIECEFGPTRRASVSERVSFALEKTDRGVRVSIRDRPETEELLPREELRDSVTRVAYAYTERHLGPRKSIGNKGGGLANRIRALLKE